MSDDTPRSSRAVAELKDRALTWIFGLVATVALGAAGFAHGKLWSHEVSISRLEVQQSNDSKTIERMDAKLDKLLDRFGVSKP